MKEITTKPDVRETGNRPGRIEIPSERFAPDRNKPCDNITRIEPVGTSMYRVYDAKTPTIPADTISRARFGDYKCNGKDWILFEKPSSSGSQYNICDSKGKPLSPQTGNRDSTSIGKFVKQSGEYMTFEKGNMIFTYDKNFKQIGSSRPK